MPQAARPLEFRQFDNLKQIDHEAVVDEWIRTNHKELDGAQYYVLRYGTKKNSMEKWSPCLSRDQLLKISRLAKNSKAAAFAPGLFGFGEDRNDLWRLLTRHPDEFPAFWLCVRAKLRAFQTSEMSRARRILGNFQTHYKGCFEWKYLLSWAARHYRGESLPSLRTFKAAATEIRQNTCKIDMLFLHGRQSDKRARKGETRSRNDRERNLTTKTGKGSG